MQEVDCMQCKPVYVGNLSICKFQYLENQSSVNTKDGKFYGSHMLYMDFQLCVGD